MLECKLSKNLNYITGGKKCSLSIQQKIKKIKNKEIMFLSIEIFYVSSLTIIRKNTRTSQKKGGGEWLTKSKRPSKIKNANLFSRLLKFPSFLLHSFCSLHIFIFRTTTDFPSCLPGLSLWRLEINSSICCPVWIFTWWITVDNIKL